MTVTIAEARTSNNLAQIAELFSEYADSLGIDLSFQQFSAELAGLPGSYAPPCGELFLALDDDRRAIGCVGIRPLLGGSRCEMKRLYCRQSARGTGTGHALAAQAVAFAEAYGYEEMLLDTLPSMGAALAIYRRLGFLPVSAYYTNPVPGALYFRRSLRDPAS